jgi:hypothetical protein
MALADRDDLADAALVANVATALRAWRDATGRPPSSKVLREAIWFFWQAPRLQRPLVAKKYPRSAPWSEEAAGIVLRGEVIKDRLAIEHTEPLNRTYRWLLDDIPNPETIAAELSGRLGCVIVTAEQGRAIPDAGTPHERYTAAGLDLSSFRSLDDWAAAARAVST